MNGKKTTAMKEGTLLSAVMKLVTFPLNVMWDQAALVQQTPEAVTASKDSVSLVGQAKKEKVLRFRRNIGALTTLIVNAGDMQLKIQGGVICAILDFSQLHLTGHILENI